MRLGKVAYFLINIAYSLYFKRIAILDVIIIATGFVQRLFVEVTTMIPLSMWIVVMIFLLTLFMVLAKRRDDDRLFLDTGKQINKTIDGYNMEFF